MSTPIQDPNGQSLVERARSMAVSLHEACGHTRSTGEPYWRHPERVVQTLRDHAQRDELLAAGWLHDVPEDCPPDEGGCKALLMQIVIDFGPEVGSIVREVTNFFGPDATMEEKQARLREHALHMSDDAKWLKLADRMDNITGMQGWPAPKRQRYAQATLALIDALRPWPEGAQPLALNIIAAAERILATQGGA